jgi:aromatic-L-amino-acid decarboxylase
MVDVAAALAARHLATVGELRVATPMSPADVRASLAEFDFDAPRDGAAVLEHSFDLLRRGTTHSTHPRYFGLFNPTPLPVGVAAATLVAATNPQLAVWSHAPAAIEIEHHVLRFIGARLGYDPAAVAGSFTTGGAEANHTAVLVALTRRFPALAREGLRALDRQPTIHASREAHLALAKIAHACGLGREALRLVDVGPDLRMRPDALAAAIAHDREEGREPFLVVATAGTTSSGTIDPLPEIADVCAATGVALHVDAAWAGAACLSDALRPALAGIERAASVTIDAHKWLSLPMGAGMFLSTDLPALGATFGLAASYMPPQTGDAIDPYSHSMQWSRRHAGLGLFAALAALGRSGYAAMLESMCALGDDLRTRLIAAGWEIVNTTPLPVVCAADRLLDRSERASPGAYARAAERLQARGAAWASATVVGGRPVLRACITSYRSVPDDLDVLLDELGRARRSEAGV